MARRITRFIGLFSLLILISAYINCSGNHAVFNSNSNNAPAENGEGYGGMTSYYYVNVASLCTQTGTNGQPLPNAEIDNVGATYQLVRTNCSMVNPPQTLSPSSIQVTNNGTGDLVYQNNLYVPQPVTITNLLLFSQDFTNIAWQNVANPLPTTTANAALAPDGTMTATKVVGPTAVTNTSIFNQLVTMPANVGGQTFSFSIWVKGTIAGNNAILLLVADTSPNWDHNVVAGPDIRGTYANWTRLTLTGAIGTDSPNNQVTANLGCSYGACTADMSQSNFYIWGGQLQVGPVITSYVPTTSAQK